MKYVFNLNYKLQNNNNINNWKINIKIGFTFTEVYAF